MVKKKIAVLCSGGVDSSVALHLLYLENKYDITVFYLKIWLEDELSYLSTCPWEEDLEFIRKTCALLQLHLEIIPLQKEYWHLVVAKSITMIKQGFTPNPDIFCNSMIKFGAFFDMIADHYHLLATGHYAYMNTEHNWHYLTHTEDIIKDQTYFLSYTQYEKLARSIFPLHVFKNKNEVRAYALMHQLPSATRRDSQGICFLGKIPFEQFLQHHCGIRKGKLIEYESKKIMGEHNGFWFFTIGQRHGIKLHGGPWYVIQKEIENNIIYISRQTPKIMHCYINSIITVSHINFLVPENEKMKIDTEYHIKIRHGQYFNMAKIIQYQNNTTITIQILEPDQGIAEGQMIAFYLNKKICLGSGIITKIAT